MRSWLLDGRSASSATEDRDGGLDGYSPLQGRQEERAPLAGERRAEIEQGLALGQLIYGLRTQAGLSQRELAARMVTTQS